MTLFSIHKDYSLLTSSGGWYSDLDKLAVIIHNTLEAHLAEQLCNVLCSNVDAYLLVDFFHFNSFLPVSQPLLILSIACEHTPLLLQ